MSQKRKMRKKSAASSKNDRGPKKNFLADEKPVKPETTKKSIGNHKKQSVNKFDADSLEYLRDITEKRKLNQIDEKIKLLKTELKSLLLDKKFDNDYSINSINNFNSDQLNLQNFSQLKPVISKSEFTESKENCEDFNNVQVKKESSKLLCTSMLSTFSKQLVENMHEEIFVETGEEKLFDSKNILLSTESQVDTTKKSIHPPLKSTSSLCDLLSLSDEKVEELLYESFVMQNSKLSLVHSKEIHIEHKKLGLKTKKRLFQRSEKQSKISNKNFTQQKLNKCWSGPWKKKQKICNINSSQSDVEVVNLESSSCNNVELNNEITCIDLDVTNCDWNEPFDLDTKFHSELEILENSKEKETAKNQGLQLNNTDRTEKNCFNDKKETTPFKKAWECPVCFEQSKGQEVVATQCGHIFCKKCLENHFLKLNKSCPTCRENLQNKPVITLFNI